MVRQFLTKTQRELLTKVLSLSLSLSFIFTATITPANAAPLNPVSQVESALLKQLTPPSEIGTIVDAHISAKTPLVIHIQDLHANYGVQTNVVKLLEFMDSRLGAGNYRVAVEGAEGPVAVTELAKINDRNFKTKVCDLLMKEAELTGTAYFSIVNGKPDLLWGVEDHRYHDANIALFQSTYKGKQQLAKALDKLQKDLLPIKDKFYTRAMRKLDKKAADYASGKIDMADYTAALVKQVSKLGINITAQYPEIAKWTGYAKADKYANIDKLMTEQTDLFKEVQAGMAKTEVQRNIATTENELDVLRRLFVEEVTTEEVRHLAPQLSHVVGRAQYLLDSSGLSYDKKNLAELASASLDFYAVALLRDKFLAENTMKLFRESWTVNREPKSRSTVHGVPSTIVLVAGGFHTPGITQVLKEKGVSYVTIAPTVTTHTEHDKRLYVARLMDQHPNPEDLLMGNRMLSPDANNPRSVAVTVQTTRLAAIKERGVVAAGSLLAPVKRLMSSVAPSFSLPPANQQPTPVPDPAASISLRSQMKLPDYTGSGNSPIHKFRDLVVLKLEQGLTEGPGLKEVKELQDALTAVENLGSKGGREEQLAALATVNDRWGERYPTGFVDLMLDDLDLALHDIHLLYVELVKRSVGVDGAPASDPLRGQMKLPDYTGAGNSSIHLIRDLVISILRQGKLGPVLSADLRELYIDLDAVEKLKDPDTQLAALTALNDKWDKKYPSGHVDLLLADLPAAIADVALLRLELLARTAASGAPGGSAATVPAQTVVELLKNIGNALVVTQDGVRIVDENLLRSETVLYLVNEARFSKIKDVRESAQRILREAGLALGAKEASIHDFYMARKDGKWPNATIPAYNIRVNAFETMKGIFKAAIADNSVFILELAKSEKRYTDQSLAEFTAMGYAAAIATGYKGLIFFQGDHYQTDKKVYVDQKQPAKAKKEIEDLIREAVLAGKRNIDVDPSTLVNEEALDQILALEKKIVDRYIEQRSRVNTSFAEHVAGLGGVQADVTKESAGMKSQRRMLVDDLEVGYESGKEYQDYQEALGDAEFKYIGRFGMKSEEKSQIKLLYRAMHATTFEVTMHYIRYIRNLEKELGITSPISVGVEERHIDTPKHKDFPSTVLGSITLMRQVIDQSAKEGLVGPSKLALQTGTMHGVGGVVEWGIFERHQRARKAIGVEIFVQHGTSTLDKPDFINMPIAGTGEAHLATEYQKISLGIIASHMPDLRNRMTAYLEALIYPAREVADKDIETKLNEAKLLDVEKREKDYAKFRAKWEAAMEQPGKRRDDMLIEIFNDSMPGKLKGSLKDLVKELPGPFKREIAEIPAVVQSETNETLLTEFRRINRDQNVVGVRKTLDAIMPYDSQEAVLPARPPELVKAAQEGLQTPPFSANRPVRSLLVMAGGLIATFFAHPILGGAYAVWGFSKGIAGYRVNRTAGHGRFASFVAAAARHDQVEKAQPLLQAEEVLHNIPLVGKPIESSTLLARTLNETLQELIPNLLDLPLFAAGLVIMGFRGLRNSVRPNEVRINNNLLSALQTIPKAVLSIPNSLTGLAVQALERRGVKAEEIKRLRERGRLAIFAAA